MEIIEIYGDNRFERYSKVREACRGNVMKKDMLLLTYEVNTDQWFIPGGGIEEKESVSDCCVRELGEETGMIVDPKFHFLTINEYYEDWLFISHYFLCDKIGEVERQLTQREAEVGLEPRWIPLEEAISIFSKHQDYAEDEMKRGVYLREYLALQSYCKIKL